MAVNSSSVYLNQDINLHGYNSQVFGLRAGHLRDSLNASKATLLFASSFKFYNNYNYDIRLRVVESTGGGASDYLLSVTMEKI